MREVDGGCVPNDRQGSQTRGPAVAARPRRAGDRIVFSDFRCCEGFRMPAGDGGGGELSGLRAGVRKPPKEEIAGGDT